MKIRSVFSMFGFPALALARAGGRADSPTPESADSEKVGSVGVASKKQRRSALPTRPAGPGPSSIHDQARSPMTHERRPSSLSDAHPARFASVRRSAWALPFAFALGCGSAGVGDTTEQTEQTTSAVTTTAPLTGVPLHPVAETGAATGSGGTCKYNVIKQVPSSFTNTSPLVWNVYWGGLWNQTTGSPSGASQRSTIDKEWNWVASASAFWSRLTEYGIDPNHSGFKGSYVRETSLGASAQVLTEPQIQNLLSAEFDAFGTNSLNVPYATLNPPQIYVVYLPPNVQSQYDVTNGFSGHHLSFQWKGRNVWYGVIEYQASTDTANVIASHEISEAATDPDGGSGYRADSGESEIGDLCSARTQIGGYPVQTMWSQQRCRCVGHRDADTSDFGGNGRASYTIFRPSTGTWWVNSQIQSSASFAWGQSGDIPVAGDYNGDGWVDLTVFRPSTGQWIGAYDSPFGLGSWSQWRSGPTSFTTNWGANGDIPLSADWDADGKIDLTVFRPSNGTWYGLLSSNGAALSAAWGAYGDAPVPADYDGDGKADAAVWRPSNSTYYVSLSGGGTITLPWGISTDIAVPADYDGDGIADLAVWRPSNGTWYVRPSSNTSTMWTQQWGANGDIPIPGDYDGDWRADYAVWRPSSGLFYVIPTTTGAGYSITWGVNGDIPIPPYL
jgi:hypothetical protein